MMEKRSVPMTSAESLRHALSALVREGKLDQQTLDHLSFRDLKFALYDWPLWARPEQLPPDEEKKWQTWLFLGGRGAGKTRAGSEWVRGLVQGQSWAGSQAVGRIALIGANYLDAREVMIEGESGLLAIHPARERPKFYASRRRLEWSNGAIAELFSAEDPDALRGPQFGAAWADELAKWEHLNATWDMLQFALRLGSWPRQLVTTTPRPLPLIRDLMALSGTHVSRASTLANKAFLAPGFLSNILDRYGGSRLGRQEINGEILDDREDALWSRGQFEALRASTPEGLSRIIVAVDPPAGGKHCVCGIIVAGLDKDGLAYVLEDGSLEQTHPEAWVGQAVRLYHAYEADALIAESNHGGDMIATLFRQVAPEIPLRQVRAIRGKRLRAEPVAELYSRGRVRHCQTFAALEDQMCQFGLDGLADGRSPDRLDALVWALSDLLLQPKGDPRIRSL